MGFLGRFKFALCAILIFCSVHETDAGCKSRLKNLALPAYSVALGTVILTTNWWFPRLLRFHDERVRQAAIQREVDLWASAKTPAEAFRIISNRYIRSKSGPSLESIPADILKLGSADSWALVFRQEVGRYLVEVSQPDGSSEIQIHLDGEISEPFEVIRSLDVLSHLANMIIETKPWGSISESGLEGFRQALYIVQQFGTEFPDFVKKAPPPENSSNRRLERQVREMFYLVSLLMKPPPPMAGIEDSERLRSFGLLWASLKSLPRSAEK
jgi:hypothetical protein